ncbi:MAG: lysophospholipid acyltransferase family protein [Candidatus Gastranaerophilaceae bacterium]|nr:lysophospholipid acyltransferase family protein [Candidatus Gastranaerophilaceae bacterium]
MVRLINKENAIYFGKAVSAYLQTQTHFTHIYEIGNPYLKPCIYAMWHSDQFCIYGVKNRTEINILISNSSDGDIITYAVEGLGFKTVRGSSKRGGVKSTLQLVEILEKGECVAIMVDGPNGPLHKVKNGVVRIAKMAGVPIIPVGWYSPQWSFIKLPSWDKMTIPIGKCNILNIYGEPIYVPKDATVEDEAKIRQQLKTTLEDIGNRLPEEYKKAKKNKVWENLKK